MSYVVGQKFKEAFNITPKKGETHFYADTKRTTQGQVQILPVEKRYSTLAFKGGQHRIKENEKLSIFF